MKITNLTKNTVLASNVTIADTPLKRMVGLLNRSEFNDGEALILVPCNSIHTLFMRFSIDVLFVDRDNKVIKVIKQLKPFTITPICFRATSVIELPPNAIQSALTQEGDLLLLEREPV